eukprot:541265-Rhodomonas_salina.3
MAAVSVFHVTPHVVNACKLAVALPPSAARASITLTEHATVTATAASPGDVADLAESVGPEVGIGCGGECRGEEPHDPAGQRQVAD